MVVQVSLLITERRYFQKHCMSKQIETATQIEGLTAQDKLLLVAAIHVIKLALAIF